MTHATRIAHALQKLKVSMRLLKEAEKEVRTAFEDARKPKHTRAGDPAVVSVGEQRPQGRAESHA